jgi:hypothetical protein
VNPVRGIAALDSGFRLDVSCSSGDSAVKGWNFGLSNIAQQNFETWTNMQ